MMYQTHLFPRGYFHTKDVIIVINIMEVIEQTQIHLQRGGQTDRWMNNVKQIYPATNTVEGYKKGKETKSSHISQAILYIFLYVFTYSKLNPCGAETGIFQEN